MKKQLNFLNNMGKQRRIAGQFLEIQLPDLTWTYARVLDKASFAFYDVHSLNKIADINFIMGKNVIFIAAVFNDAVTSGRWKKIGIYPLEARFHILPFKFIQDEIDSADVRLYNPNTGEIFISNRRACIDLEPAAVWDAEQIEERIVDYYAGRTNVWLEKMKLK